LGAQGNLTSDRPTVSGDGNLVAFWSDASNLVAGDMNFQRDVFLHDRSTGVTTIMSADAAGVLGNGPSSRPALSADGMFLTFTSDATNLVAGDTNMVGDVFVRDLTTGVIEMVSLTTTGGLSNGLSSVPTISADGRYVSYRSIATNLVPGDTNLSEDVFLHIGQGWSDGPPPLVNDTISLAAAATHQVNTRLTFQWADAPATSNYYLLYSFNSAGMSIYGHDFDVGNPWVILTQGRTSATGIGSYQTMPIPPTAAGLTVYFEMASQNTAGTIYDSNLVPVTFF